MRWKRIRTVYLPIRRMGKVVHIATVRSDWTWADFAELDHLFPGGYVLTSRYRTPLSFLGSAYHNTTFDHIARWKFI